NRIAEFRKRLEGMPRLVPAQRTDEPPSTPPEPNPDQAEAGSRTQAIIEKSLQRLAGADCAGPPPLSNNARRLLSDAHGMVTRLKAMADDPLLADRLIGADVLADTADPLAVHFRETASLTEACVRYAMTFPPAADEQARLCEGLEGMIDAARGRFAVVGGALECRRAEDARVRRPARVA